MNRFPPPEADEAQRRHYNDSYNPYEFAPSPPPPPPLHQSPPPGPPPSQHPYDQPHPYEPQHLSNTTSYYTAPSNYGGPGQHQDPFAASNEQFSLLAPPPPPPGPPPQDPFGSPPNGPRPLSGYGSSPGGYTSPPPPPGMGGSPPRPGPGVHPLHSQSSFPASTTAYNPTSYGDDEQHDEAGHESSGAIPLLRRDPSQSDSFVHVDMPIPGAYGYPPSGPGGGGGDDDVNFIRYGRIPARVPRRYKTIKKVELFHGNYVNDQPVPSKLLDMCTFKTDREFTHMRYSAVTCDPNSFSDSGFTLRQIHYDPPRRTELFIVMTMYNEDEELFTRTMHGVIKNVAHLCKRERSKTWGKEGWKKVVVCIVSDGRAKINSRTLSVLAAMGVYQEDVAKQAINSTPVTAHVFEYTTQVSVTPSLKIEGPEKGVVPIQIIFCLKELNAKKINSHRWFFNAFGPVLQPNVCVLLDVGTEPGPTSIYHLWKAFDINSNVGGACGEIVALKGRYWRNLLNPLVAAQNFEYKMSNILDKPLESIFGYITVLPGAFSAYRYIALQNDVTGEGPLQKYFLGEKMHGAGADIFTANMYLAEDRILCWELVSKRGGSWTLHYVKSAYAITDVPDQVPELISQRRRWLNGSFFAAVHSTFHFYYIYRSSHSFVRKAWIHVEMVYQAFNLIFSWFSLANFYIAFSVLTSAMETLIPQTHWVNIILNYFYVGLLIMCFILSLGNRPQGSKWGYTWAMLGFAVVTIYMTIAAFLLAFKGIQQVADEIKEHTGHAIGVGDVFTNPIFRNIVLSLLATTGLYLIASLIFFEPWHMITSFIQYLLMAPSYIAVLNVYAFANVHDVSWGTKGDNAPPAKIDNVTTGKGDNKNMAEVAGPTSQKDLNMLYEDAIHVLQTKKPKEEAKVNQAQKEEDYYRAFRTNVLLAWTLSNALLAALIVKTNNNSSASNAVNGYMAFLLFSVAGLAFVRFVGSTAYMVVRLFAGE